MKRIQKEKGFSLVELMVVVAVISILASIAVPRFRIYQAKARRTEAATNLNQIYTLEQSYYGDNDNYLGLGATGDTTTCNDPSSLAIGFIINPCVKARYKYSTTIPAAAATGASFSAQAATGTGAANKVLPNCTTADIWTIDDKNTLAPPTVDPFKMAACL